MRGLVSIIVPVFNEEESLPLFYDEFIRLRERMRAEFAEELELILVDDGSRDGSLALMKGLAERDTDVKYISFSRNFGKESAIFAGLSNARGDYAVLMDADLQDPPSLLPEMYRALREEGYDSVATRRVSRSGEPPIRSFFARRFYALMNRISRTDMVDGARDYRLMSRRFVDALLSLGEYNRFSKGLFGWVGFKTKWLEYENVERVAGETKWSFWGLFLYAIDGIVAFSTVPLQISAVLGVLLSLAAFLALVFIVVRRVLFGDPVAGWASTMTMLLFTSGIQMLFIGILGQYLAKTYLEVKKRPVYIVAETNIR